MLLKTGEFREGELRELEGRLRDLYREISLNVTRRIRDIADYWGGVEVEDEIERAESSKQKELRWNFIERSMRTLKDIETAIEKFENGKFGKCSCCGNEIPISRLRALPFAALCRNCQEVAEDTNARNF